MKVTFTFFVPGHGVKTVPVDLTYEEESALRDWYGDDASSLQFDGTEYDDEISRLYGPHYQGYDAPAHAAANALEKAFDRMRESQQ